MHPTLQETPQCLTSASPVLCEHKQRPPNPAALMQAFPAGSGPQDRTTYMFTYIDANKERPSQESLLEDYWRLMPQYQVGGAAVPGECRQCCALPGEGQLACCLVPGSSD